MSREDKILSEALGEEETLAPIDLYNTDFSRRLTGGYDKGEVDALFERAGDKLEALIEQARTLKEKNEALNELVAFYRETEESLRKALVSAQQLGEDVLDSARREAGAIVEEANLEREKSRREAAACPARLRAEIQTLQTARNRLRDDLRAVLATHEALIDSIGTVEGVEIGALAGFEDEVDAGKPELAPEAALNAEDEEA